MINSFLSEFVHDIKFSVPSCSSFLSGVPSFFNYIFSKLHLIIARLLPEFFSTFHFVWSFFYYRSSSWRLYMVVRQGFLSFFDCSSRFLLKLWSAKLYSKIHMVPNTCFVLRSSSILLLAFPSAIPSTLSSRWRYIILDNFHSCFMSHMLSRMRYSKSISPSIGFILVKISPKAFPKEYC